MNLLTINSYNCSPVASGGVNRITDILSRQFTARGINCFLGYFEPQPENIELTPFVDRILLNRNFDREAFKAFLTKNHIDIVQVNFLKKENLVTMPIIYKCAQECDAKVIYAFHMCPGFQTVTYGTWEMVRFCIHQHKNVLKETKKWLITMFRPLMRAMELPILRSKYRIPYENCDRMVTLSANFYKPYLRLAGVKESAKMTAIPNALRFERYATEEDIEQKEKTILVVARFDEDTKRISLVLEAWRELEPQFSDWRLQVVGDGRDRVFYDYLVKKWKFKRVEFTGQQNPQEYYRRASIFLMTSSAEGWGMTLTEAMQMGTPVIAMDTYGALHDIITEGYNGHIVGDKDMRAFAGAMIGLMQDDGRRLTLSRNAVESSKRFETSKVVEKWMALFGGL